MTNSLQNNFIILLPTEYNNQDLTNYYIEKFVSGLRVITFIEYIDDKINIKFYTVDHKEITLSNELKKELKDLYKKSLYYRTNIIIDGVLDDFKQYICFDILLLEEFIGLKQSMKYSIRYNNLKKFLSSFTSFIKLIFAVPYTSEHLNKLTKEFLDTNKWNGFIFRKDSKYNSQEELLKFLKK